MIRTIKNYTFKDLFLDIKYSENKTPIYEIEKRSKEDVINLLKSNNLGKNERNIWCAYSKAKKLCFENQWIDSKIYDKQIYWICEYLNI